MDLKNGITISYERLMSFIRNYYFENFKTCMSKERLAYIGDMHNKKLIQEMDCYFSLQYENFDGYRFCTRELLLSNSEIEQIINYYLQNVNLEVNLDCFYINKAGTLDSIFCSIRKISQKTKVKEYNYDV